LHRGIGHQIETARRGRGIGHRGFHQPSPAGCRRPV
jgi:hypothetical protein